MPTPEDLDSHAQTTLTAAPSATALEGYADPPQSTGHSLIRVIASLRRYRWIILGLTLIGLGGGILATRFIKPNYEVQANIWIETPNRGKMGPIQGDELLESRAWVELLTTFTVLDPVVQQQRLYLHYEQASDSSLFQHFDLGTRFLPGQFELAIAKDGKSYTLKQRNGMYNESGSMADSIGRQVGFRWAPRPQRSEWGRTVKFDVVTPREASGQLVSNLTPRLKEGNFLSLSLRGQNAAQAEATLNSLVRRFVDEAANQKRRKLTLLSAVLDTQVINQAARLKAAEEALESFRVGTVTMPREDAPVAPGLQFTQPTVYGQFFAQRTMLDSLRRDQRDIEEVLRQSRESGVPIDAFNTIGSVRQAPDLQKVLGELSTAEAKLRELRTKYTDEYREVRDQLDRIQILRTTTIPLYAGALVRQLQDRQTELTGRLGTATRELQSIPVRSQNEARLRREVEQAENLFRQLEASRQQARLAEASAIPDVRILDSAVAPSHPSHNSSSSLILMGLLLGLGAGIGIAFLADRFDPRFRYPDQVSAGLGLPILGTIPEIKRAKGQMASTDEAAQVVEAFRSIRMSLAHSFDSSGPIALTISSPSPGDGKSLIASNLALSFAEAGYRTVLVDGDIRRGGLHQTFGLERRPGLVDFLAGEVSLGAILRQATHPLLTLIPCGSRRHLGPELLGSVRMRELMEQLRKDYQVIIMDSPPLGAGIDPFVLATVAGHLALVLRAGETDRQFTEAKLRILDRLPVRMLGAILNDVRLNEGAYKYYRYSYGYAAEEEVEPVGKPKLTSGSPSS
jgi:capsular exopolysaccharide synthesis family protein